MAETQFQISSISLLLYSFSNFSLSCLFQPIEKGKNESERKLFLLDDDHHCEPVANIRQGNDDYKNQLKKSSTSSIKHVQAVQTSSITNTKQKTEQIAKIESKSPKPKTADALTSLVS